MTHPAAEVRPERRAERLSAWQGRFANPALEAEFARRMWPHWARTTRIVALLAATLALGFCYVDYLALGWGLKLWAAWALRFSILGSACYVAYASRRPSMSLDRAALVMMVTFSVAIVLLVYLERKGLMREAPSTILAVLGFYLFVPTRFAYQCCTSLFLSFGFLTAQVLWGPHTTGELVAVSTELVLCNVLGGFTALRTHLLQRREYLGLRRIRERERLEQFVARQSTRFITLSPDQIERGIREALVELGDLGDADRSFVFEFDHARKLLSCTHEWCRDGIAAGTVSLQKVPFDEFAWGIATLLRGAPIVALRLDDLPPEAAAEKAQLSVYGAKSIVAVPLIVGDRVIGALGVHAVQQELEAGDDFTALLGLVGAMVVGAMERRKTELELQHKQQALEKSVGALEASNQELQQFVYVASHDLQEPLRSISSFASLLEHRYRGRLDQQGEDYINHLTAATARMRTLIADLLAYSRLVTQARAFMRCQTGGIVQLSLTNLQASIDESGARIEIGPMPAVQGDPSQLVQVFQNLIGNAITFNESEPPRVWLRARRTEGLCHFTVADNGIGIEPEHLQRIFQPFARLHTPEQYPGTGIGLAVCQRIVERHGGRIWAERRAPHGTMVHFTLPAAAQAEKGAGADVRFTVPAAPAPQRAPTPARGVPALETGAEPGVPAKH